MKYCPISTTVKNPASKQNLLNLSCCDITYNSFSVSMQWKIFVSMIIIIQKHVGLDHARMRNSTVLPKRVAAFYRGNFVLFTHFFDCFVKTELIHGSICANNSCNRVLVGHNSGSTIFHHLCFSADLWTMDSWLEKLGVRFLRVSIIFSTILSSTPCRLSSLIEEHFVSEPGPINDHCPIPNHFAKRETSRAFDLHSFLLSLEPHELSLNIDMKNPSCEILWCFTELQRGESRVFHSNSMGSTSVLSKVLDSDVLWTIPIFVPMHRSIGVFSCILPRHNTESGNTLTFVRWRLTTLSSPINDKHVHEEISFHCLHSVDFVWLFGHQFRKCVAHLFHCEIFCILDGMPSVWVILSHEYRWFHCWKHEHSPFHRKFFRCLCNIHRRSVMPFALDHSPYPRIDALLCSLLRANNGFPHSTVIFFFQNKMLGLTI